MKNNYLVIVISTLFAGTFFTSVESPNQLKHMNPSGQYAHSVRELTREHRHDEAKKQKEALVEEWKTLWKVSGDELDQNTRRIDLMRDMLSKGEKAFDDLYLVRIESVERKNENLRAMIETYEQTQEDWSWFKLDFTRKMEELTQTLEEIEQDYHY